MIFQQKLTLRAINIMIATSTFINVYHKNEDYAIILKYKSWNHLPPHRLKLMYVKHILRLNLWRKLTSKILYEDGTLFNTKYVFNCSFQIFLHILKPRGHAASHHDTMPGFLLRKSIYFLDIWRWGLTVLSDQH